MIGPAAGGGGRWVSRALDLVHGHMTKDGAAGV